MVAKNHCLMKLRDKGKYTAEINENVIVTADDGTRKLEAAENEKALNNMETALENLNMEQQLCIRSFYLQKKTYQQIAVETGYTIMQVKSSIQNGKRNLKIQMQRTAPDEQ